MARLVHSLEFLEDFLVSDVLGVELGVVVLDESDNGVVLDKGVAVVHHFLPATSGLLLSRERGGEGR